MEKQNQENIIQHTKNWIEKVVIKNNFCPFAAKEVQQESIRYVVIETTEELDSLEVVYREINFLHKNKETETTLLIFPKQLNDFSAYLSFLDTAEALLLDQGFEGIYQIASFHPNYQFAGSPPDDAANFTNRSPYPMLHLLREDSLEKALQHYKNPDLIPIRNVELARKIGAEKMEQDRLDCFIND